MPRLCHATDAEVVFEFEEDTRPMWAASFAPTRAPFGKFTYAQAVKGASKGYRAFAPHGNKGMCMTLICKWVKASIENAGAVTAEAQFGSLHDAGIAHSAYRRNNADLPGLFGLTEDDEMAGAAKAPLDLDDVASVTEWVGLPGEQVYLVLQLMPPDRFGTTGHVVGFKTGPSGWAYFDPNYGLYRFAGQARLAAVIEGIATDFFTGMNARFGGGAWVISELKRAG